MATLKFMRSYDEVGNIRTFVFEKGDLNWQPGQYQAYNLLQLGDDPEKNEHWFTLASAPSEDEIHISTRVTNSDFKQTLNSLKEGDTVETHDLEGDFTWDGDQPVVLIAGGIGVTPFRSMLVERAATGQKIPATLLYYGRDENFAFRGEFDKIQAEHPELVIKYLAGQP
ncbi:MAG TPA: FAD-dependent oxidoreductase, partial [Candidatus Saccharimonadaceae bacterium]|nr:FAD-dependent oxidoreductase [Candidatus Saccharimonadaceae bacterium]